MLGEFSKVLQGFDITKELGTYDRLWLCIIISRNARKIPDDFKNISADLSERRAWETTCFKPPSAIENKCLQGQQVSAGAKSQPGIEQEANLESSKKPTWNRAKVSIGAAGRALSVVLGPKHPCPEIHEVYENL